MRTIEVNDDKFTCPMMNKELKKNEEAPNFVTCVVCKKNILGQIVDNKIYCDF